MTPDDKFPSKLWQYDHPWASFGLLLLCIVMMYVTIFAWQWYFHGLHMGLACFCSFAFWGYLAMVKWQLVP